MNKFYFILFTILLFFSCSEEEPIPMFSLMSSASTGIDFENNLPYTEEFNTYTYRNFYNGGGVAIGDINNDGLPDILFTGNIVDNKLYLNKGNWEFEDITAKAGVACQGVWSSGACMADVNGDGWLDIYICKAGKPEGENRHNELFINNGDLTFSEESKKYGLDITGLSIHSAFFDFDKDGDLDCYLLNNSVRSVGGFDLKKGLRDIPDAEGNKFFRNDEGTFVDVTTEVGMYSSNIGYGLGITLSDFDKDGWTDVFISNDFFERDYLYYNNQDGTFSEAAAESFHSLSMGSMGADACDIDNDLLPDLFVTEMLPKSHSRKKTKTQYDSWDKYQASLKNDYHHQFSRNALQRNMGNQQFLEISRYAGVAATDWSWAALIQDFDNDGMKDLFVSNGIYKDLLDKDYLAYHANDAVIQQKIRNKEEFILPLIDKMPSMAIANSMYHNKGDFQFDNVSEDWGLGTPTFSNGSAYGDLDNDGDLDLVINNANMPSFVYRNNLDTLSKRSIQIKLKGKGKNSQALGATITVFHQNGQAYYENYTSKGFESSVDNTIHIGVGDVKVIDSLIIQWPDGTATKKNNLKTNKRYTYTQEEQESNAMMRASKTPIPEGVEIPFEHKEMNTNMFSRERMLMEMPGFDGPSIAVGDVNGDGFDDIFVGGGKNQESELFFGDALGKYKKSRTQFSQNSKAEVVVCTFFDSDNDGDLDLLVGHGGKTFSAFSREMDDVLYINDGNGEFEKKKNAISFSKPMHTGDIVTGDLNSNGYQDVVVVEKMDNTLYGLPGAVIILLNRGDNAFTNFSNKSLSKIGMISSVELVDTDNDGDKDIISAGQWMPLTIIENESGKFSNVTRLPNTSGLWNVMHSYDIDGDGDMDLICGNEGKNTFYKPGMKMYIHDFDNNGGTEQIIAQKVGSQYFAIQEADDLYSQLPFLKKKYNFYNDIAEASMEEMFGAEILDASQQLSIEMLESVIFINDNGIYRSIPLPAECQYSSIHAIYAERIDDNTSRIIVGGNRYKVKPQFGRQDASEGWVFNVNNRGDSLSFDNVTPLAVKGEIRDIKRSGHTIIFGVNDDSIETRKLENEEE